MKLDKNDTHTNSNNLPDSFCKYHTKISPVIKMNNK